MQTLNWSSKPGEASPCSPQVISGSKWIVDGRRNYHRNQKCQEQHKENKQHRYCLERIPRGTLQLQGASVGPHACSGGSAEDFCLAHRACLKIKICLIGNERGKRIAHGCSRINAKSILSFVPWVRCNEQQISQGKVQPSRAPCGLSCSHLHHPSLNLVTAPHKLFVREVQRGIS